MNETPPVSSPLPIEDDGWRLPVPWLGLTLVFSVLLLTGWYWYQTSLPAQVVIAGGPEEGRYYRIAQALALELQQRLGIDVQATHTEGSLDNLHQLAEGTVHLGLYQSETRVVLDQADHSREPARFVANLYPEYLIPVVTADSQLNMTQLQDRVISCTGHQSGDHAMLELMWRHLGDGSPLSSRMAEVPYRKVPTALSAGEVDLAVISCGLDAPVLRHLLVEERCRLIDIPYLDSFEARNTALIRCTIPAGYFATQPAPIPQKDFQTVATQAQLLAGKQTSVQLVETATEIILDPEFQRRMHLKELHSRGTDYAMSRPGFPLHAGASHVYSPELKPLLNPDFVEGTEGIRSFLVSIIAAIWLARRWWKRRLLLSQEHKLDRYIRGVLQIEQDQVGLDGDHPDDANGLQLLLDRVTELRQAALSEFNAHELNEDQAVDCFVEMCHALSDKISGKLTRHALRHVVAASGVSNSADASDSSDPSSSDSTTS